VKAIKKDSERKIISTGNSQSDLRNSKPSTDLSINSLKAYVRNNNAIGSMMSI
jgi:hypothetical protein